VVPNQLMVLFWVSAPCSG